MWPIYPTGLERDNTKVRFASVPWESGREDLLSGLYTRQVLGDGMNKER